MTLHLLSRSADNSIYPLRYSAFFERNYFDSSLVLVPLTVGTSKSNQDSRLSLFNFQQLLPEVAERNLSPLSLQLQNWTYDTNSLSQCEMYVIRNGPNTFRPTYNPPQYLVVSDTREESAWQGCTLHKAATNASRSALKIVARLILSQAEINQQDERGKTPLHEAAANKGDCGSKIVRLMLENGAKVNIFDRYHSSPFLIALMNESHGAYEMINLMLEHEEEVELLIKNSSNSVFFAALQNKSLDAFKLLQLLLRKGFSLRDSCELKI
jgi:ankyrin repeat protein